MAETRPLRFLIAVLGILGAAALFAVVILKNRQAPETPSAADDSPPSSQAPSDPNPAALPPKPELFEEGGSEDDPEPTDGDADDPIDSDDMRAFIAGLVRPWNPDAPVEERPGTPLFPDLVLDLPKKRPAPVLIPDDGSGDVPPGLPPTLEALFQDKQTAGRKKEEDESDSSLEFPLPADAQDAAQTSQVPSPGGQDAAGIPRSPSDGAALRQSSSGAGSAARSPSGSPDGVRRPRTAGDTAASSQAPSEGGVLSARAPSGVAEASPGGQDAAGIPRFPSDGAALRQSSSDTAGSAAQSSSGSPDGVRRPRTAGDTAASSQAPSEGTALSARAPSGVAEASPGGQDAAGIPRSPSESDGVTLRQSSSDTAGSAVVIDAVVPGDSESAEAADASAARPSAAAGWRRRIARFESEDTGTAESGAGGEVGAGAAAMVEGGLESGGANGALPSSLPEAGAGDGPGAADAPRDEADVLPADLEAGALVILSPSSGGFYSSQVTVSGEAPGFTELSWRSMAMRIGGVIPLDERQSGFEVTVNTYGFNGELDIAVSGKDADGELRGSLIQLINNRTGPSIELQSPLPGDYFMDYVEVSGRLRSGAGESSDTGEAESLSWSVDGGEPRSAIFGPNGDFTFHVSMPDYDGTEDERPTDVQLTLLARDLNGNTTERRIPLIDGRLMPGLAVTGPINDSEYGAGISLRGRVSDPYAGLENGGGIQSVRYEILSPNAATRAGIVTGEISIAPDGSFDFPIFTGDLSGDQDISVVVTGNNGRQTVETLRLRQGISSIPDFAVQSGNSAVNVSWGAIPSASEYAVRVSDSTGNPVRYIVSSFSAQLGGLVNGFEYNFQMEAVLPAGEVESHQVSMIPLAPDTLQPDVTGEFRRIRVKWDEIPGSDSYAVFRAEAEDGSYQLIAEAVSGGEFIDTQVLFGRLYWYAVAPAAYTDILSASSSAETLSVQGSSIELLARLETPGLDSFYIQGEYAFAASRDDGLLLVDIAEAVRPVVLSRTEIENAVDVAVRESYAYVAAGRSGLRVVNIEDPTNPILVGSEPAGNAVAVSVSGSFAYVADLEGGLRVLDVSSSREPKRAAFSGGLEGRDVKVSGNHAYLAAGSGGILIYDISIPASPRVLSSIEMDGAERILLNEGLLIAGGLEAGVNIYDVKNPQAPKLLSRITQVPASQLDITQGFLLAGTSEELVLVDIRDPAAPLVFEAYSIPDSDAMAMAGNKLLIADRGGIDLYQTHFLGNAFITAVLDTEGRSYGISNFAGDIYVSSHKGGVAVVDSNTLEAQAVYSTEFARAAAADANNIYVADGYAGIRVIQGDEGGDIIFEGNGFVNDVAVLNDTVYAASEDGLVVLSTAGDGVRRVGTMNFPASRTLATDGVLLFAGGGDSLGLFVPVAGEIPFEASVVHVDGIRDVTAQNNTAAAVSDDGVLLFQYDASRRRINPAGEIPVVNAESVTLNDGYLYISAGYRGLLVYDIRDIESPKLISVGTDTFAVGTVIIDDTAFLVDGEGLKSLTLFVPPWLR